MSPLFPTKALAFWPFFSNSGGVGGGKSMSVSTLPLPEPSMTGNSYDGIGGGDLDVENGAVIPQEGPAGTVVDIQDSEKSTKISRYVVRPGDNLSSIAQMFNVTVNTIMWANDISNAKGIQPGQELIILPVPGIQYTVKKGGTIRDIVKKYGGDVAEAARYNNIEPDQPLAEGTVVIVPGAEMETPKPVVTSHGHFKVGFEPILMAGGPIYEGYYANPLPGGYHKTQGLHGYNAVDLGAPVGATIVAAAAGDVIISRQGGWNGGYGNYVVISHDNGTQTLYGHMLKTAVSSGEHVVAGQVIGYVGLTGKTTGPHLHFEVRGATNPF